MGQIIKSMELQYQRKYLNFGILSIRFIKMMKQSTGLLWCQIRVFSGRLTHNNMAIFSSIQKSFYRRLLPLKLVSLNSHKGKKLFAESLAQNNCEAFFPLIQQFITQSSPSTCASATMAMILNSLNIDPGYNWKGIWRWFDDFNIKHIQPKNIEEGLTLQEYHSLIQVNQAKSIAFSPLMNKDIPAVGLKQSSLSLFRSSLLACNRRPGLFLTVNFHRKTLGQTGIGHFSPIAAYNSREDMALVLDVAKFKYDSYWCAITDIYEALIPLDQASNQSRGYLINKKKYIEEKQPSSPHCLLTLDFQLNQQLKNKPYYSSQKIQNFLVDLLNDSQIHPLLIPMLYEYATLQMEYKEEFLQKSLKPEAILKINRLSAELSDQANILIKAFSHSERSIVAFLIHVFTVHFKDTHLFVSELTSLELIKFMKNCQAYLQIDFPNP